MGQAKKRDCPDEAPDAHAGVPFSDGDELAQVLHRVIATAASAVGSTAASACRSRRRSSDGADGRPCLSTNYRARPCNEDNLHVQ
jgi:hypothetical protein